MRVSLDRLVSFSAFADLLLPLIILFSPFIYGGTTILPLSIIEGLSSLLFFVFLVSILLKKEISLVKFKVLPFILFLGLVIFQLLPLPGQLLRFLSPGTVSLYREFSFALGPDYRLTICPESSIKILLEI
jgi:hypothetical protein